MIRLVDANGDPFWINPKTIDYIEYHTSFQRVELYFHSGSSCCRKTMDGSVDDAMKMIDEAKDGNN